MDAKREKEEKEAERLKELEIINNRANEIYDQVKGKDENISTKKFIKWMKKRGNYYRIRKCFEESMDN